MFNKGGFLGGSVIGLCSLGACFYNPPAGESAGSEATTGSATQSTGPASTGGEASTIADSTSAVPTTGGTVDGSSSTNETDAGTSTGDASSTGELASTATDTSTDGTDSTSTDGTASSTGEPPPPPPPPPDATVLKLEIKPIKRFEFTWAPAAGATFYRLLERPQENGEYVEIAGDIVGQSNTQFVALHQRFDASYILQACNEGGCTDSAPVDVVGSLAASVGYFKASNPGSNDKFGVSLAISADGDTLAVGTHLEDSAATGINGDQANNATTNSGAVYVFVRQNDAWSQQAYVKASNTGVDDYFGTRVALSANGDTLVVGSFNEDSNATGIGGDQTNNLAMDSGAVYVFVRENSAWSQQAYIKASNTQEVDNFGLSFALSANGDTLAVGALNEDSAATGIGGDQANNSAVNSGAVYVFIRTNKTWSQQAYLKASNTGADDLFGYAVALSADGKTLAVGAPYEDSAGTGIGGNQVDNGAAQAGAVYMFVWANNAWSQQAYIKASNTGAGDQFGYGIALSDDGDTLAVSAVCEDSAATGSGGDQANNAAKDAGAAYVFVRTNNAWSQQAYLKASNTGAGDNFGYAIAVSGDGNTLAVGAAYEDSTAIGINGDQTSNAAVDAGAAYLFVRANNSWSQRAYVKASNTGAGDYFGGSVALSYDGKTLVACAYEESGGAAGIGGNQADDSLWRAGAVYLY